MLREEEEENSYREEYGEIGARIFDAPHCRQQCDMDALKELQIIKEWRSLLSVGTTNRKKKAYKIIAQPC